MSEWVVTVSDDEVKSSSEVYGYASRLEKNFKVSLPIAGIAGDQQASCSYDVIIR